MIDYHTRRLLDLIPHGRDNAISSYELADAFGVGISELRRIINDLILDGALIVHSLRGYYIPTKEDHSEAWEYIQSFTDENIIRILWDSYERIFGENKKGGLSC